MPDSGDSTERRIEQPVLQGSPIPYWRLSSFYFFYFALLGVWLPYWPLYLQDLGFSADKIGYVAGVMMATKIIAPSIWGYLTDKTHRRMGIIRVGALLSLIVFLGLFYRQDFFWLMLIVTGFSFFWNAILAQFEVVTLSHLGGRHQRYSLIRLWGSIGFIAAVGCLGLFFDYFDLAWLPWFVVVLLAGIWLSSLIVKEPGEPASTHHGQLTLWSVLRQPPVIIFFLVCFLLQASHGPYYAFFSVYLEQHGFTRTVTGMLWSLGVIAEVLVFIIMHRLMKRFSLYQIMMVSLLLSMVRWWLIAFLVDNTAVLIVAQLLHAASFGSFHAFAVEMIRRIFSGGLRGQGMALYSGLSFGAGGAVGAVASGWIWEYSAQLTFILAGVACLIALIIGTGVRQQAASRC